MMYKNFLGRMLVLGGVKSEVLYTIQWVTAGYLAGEGLKFKIKYS